MGLTGNEGPSGCSNATATLDENADEPLRAGYVCASARYDKRRSIAG